MAKPVKGIVLSRAEYPIFNLALAAVGASLLNPEEAKSYVADPSLYNMYTSKAARTCVDEFNGKEVNRATTQVRNITNWFYGRSPAIVVDAISDEMQAKSRYGLGDWIIRVTLWTQTVSVGAVVDQLDPMWPSPYACFEMCVEQLIPVVCDLVECLREGGGLDEAEQIAF